MKYWYQILCRLVVLIGIPQVVKLLFAKRRTTIILYHDPSPDVFEQHVRFLSRHYTFITLQQFLKSLEAPEVTLPPYSLIVTFDDGHKGNYALLQTIRAYSVRPTIYVCSGIVATTRKYWFKCNGLDVQYLKSVDHDIRLKHLADTAGYDFYQQFSEEERQALSRDELYEMKAHVDFQSHTRFHPILTTCGEEVVLEELRCSKSELEHTVGQPIRHFAYPNGDYSDREIRLLKEAGYLSARTTDVGWNGRKSDPFRLKITGVSDDAPLWMLKAELTGIPGYLYNIYKSGLSWRSLRGYHRPERVTK